MKQPVYKLVKGLRLGCALHTELCSIIVTNGLIVVIKALATILPPLVSLTSTRCYEQGLYI